MKIQRLIRNLLDNASRYAPAASALEVRLSTQRDRVALCVANHGSVIPPELRERVFELYYRAQIAKWLQISPDLQYIANPGFNVDRGPVRIFSLRVHLIL